MTEQEDKVLYIKKYDITKNIDEPLNVDEVIGLFYKDYNTENNDFFFNIYLKENFHKIGDSEQNQDLALIKNGIFKYSKDNNLEYISQNISNDGKNNLGSFDKISIIFDTNSSYTHIYDICNNKLDIEIQENENTLLFTYNEEVLPNIPFFISYNNTEFLEVQTNENGVYELLQDIDEVYIENCTIRFYGNELFNPFKMRIQL